MTFVVPSTKVELNPGVHTTPGIGPSTMSTAVGGATLIFEPVGPFASTVICVGTPVKVGAVVSCTVIVKVALAGLVCASVAVHVTVLLPRWKVELDAGRQFGVTAPSTLSIAVAEE
jgi:hypothetical protein